MEQTWVLLCDDLKEVLRMTNAPANPIQQRFEKLEGLWATFTEDPDARLLRWLADDDSNQMLQLFADLQNEDVTEIPDLFVQFKAVFESSETYTDTLIESLIAQFEEIRPALAQEDISVAWVAPKMSKPAAPKDLVNVLTSFFRSYESLMEHLVIVLFPAFVADAVAWNDWLTKLMMAGIPGEIRFMVVDSIGSPQLSQLAKTQAKTVRSVDPQLGMPTAYEEIVAAVPGSGPGHDFRTSFVALTNAAGQGNVALAQEAAGRAIAIAKEQQWHYLVSTAQMALGAAFFAAGKLAETLQCYRAANQAIAGSDDVASRKLDVPTRMAEGSALIAAEQYEEAATVFQNAAVVAAKQSETASELECWRMAGWCHETADQPEQSWKCAEKALAVGRALPPADRATSTLPYVGQMLLRLADAGTNRNRRSEVDDQMVQLMGENWEESLVKGAT